jgi:Asp/Glu/hydantoin racemase
MGQQGMKIWYQNPVPLMEEFKGLEQLLAQTTKNMGRANTVVEQKWLKEGFFDPTFAYTLTYNTLSQTQTACAAEKEGYDAVVIGNALDFGLREARSLVSIPVTGVLESALYVASSLGNTYTVVVVHNQTGQFLADTVKRYGMTDRLAKIADMGIPLPEVADTYGNTEKLMSLFNETARKTIKEDYAEVLIVGCTILSSLLTMNNIHSFEGVPIIDPVWAGIKMAEVLVDARRTYGIEVCRSSVYGTFPDWEKEMPTK